MGGRGASSGISAKGNEYGSQYHTLFQSGNIKFVVKNSRDSEPLMETMTKGRVYVTVGEKRNGEKAITSIRYFDEDNKRTKQIDFDHSHKGVSPHTHHGYFHNENDGPEGFSDLTAAEKAMVDRVNGLWYKYLEGRK